MRIIVACAFALTLASCLSFGWRGAATGGLNGSLINATIVKA